MPHLVLLGDSIFDNAAYVASGGSVEERLQKHLGPGARATLLAVDGAITCDVGQQLASMPTDATHVAISVGGNDALGASSVLTEAAMSVSDALDKLALVQASFRRDYQGMLGLVTPLGLPMLVCTIYDAIPGLEAAAITGLDLFNDTILRSGVAQGCDLLDLRLVCNEAGDFSAASPIEPSAAGADKIAQRLSAWMRGAATGNRILR
jgi:hypothetical protein